MPELTEKHAYWLMGVIAVLAAYFLGQEAGRDGGLSFNDHIVPQLLWGGAGLALAFVYIWGTVVVNEWRMGKRKQAIGMVIAPLRILGCVAGMFFLIAAFVVWIAHLASQG